MSNRKSRLIKVSLALTVAVFGLMNANTRAARQDLPEGKGVELARERCIGCHEADLIVSQRLSRQGWTREVEKMIRWGAVASDSEKEILIDYFASHFKPRSSASAPAAGADPGKQIFEEKCLICHEADLTQQQRLSRQGWTREVEKMVRWGAVVTDAENEPLVDYLFKNFGPRSLNNLK
jgi:mono/diheme cytochrome c family protein